MQPTESERKERKGLVQRIKKITKNLWPQADVFVFGSFETGLWLPNSDVDIVVLTYDDTPSEELIKTLAKGEILEMADEMDLITSATVPILKFKDRVTEIYVDVCFNTENGVQGAEIVKALLAKYPEAKYLVCVFKYFLKQRALNDTYSGGIGSFLLFCMVIASIQQHPSRLNNPQHFHRYILSHYLVFFLKFFGEDFKYDQNGISILDEGSIFRKSSKRWTLTDRSNFLTVECPQKPGTDLGRCSFAIETVKKAFSHSYRLLCSQTKSLGKTPLSLLIRLDETIESRGNLRCYKGKN
jgi:non-canonical poly(A) RNA polymerase PAPD5/7